MKTSKTAKEIRNTLAQMDEALRLPELGAKQRADLLAEKSKLLVTLLNFERETEEDKQNIRIRELEQELATALAAKVEHADAPRKVNETVAAMLEQARARYDRPGLRETPQTASQEVPAPTPAHSSHEAPKPAHNDLILMRGPYVAKTDTPKHAEAPAFIPDFRTGEEKLLEAKRLTTGRL
jgi:hypothetical protein